ncbi:MAG TPA: hypothetical protein VLS94_10925 [Fusibacter sp.]|nr:hypothetical protein [Fusibacter sp.]
MIKLTSILFICFAALMILLGIIITLVPSLNAFDFMINILAICLLLTGIVLIIALIFDRFKDSKSEGDDYKKY